MSLTRKMFSNSVYLFLDLLTVNFLGLFFWFFTGRFLLPNEVGIVSTSINLALLLSSLSLLGFQGVLPKLIPEYLEKNQYKKIISLSRFTLKVLLVSNSILILVLFLFYSKLQTILKQPPYTIAISSTMLLLFTFSTFFGCIMWGFQNTRTFFTTDLIGTVLKLVVTILLLVLGFGYISPLIGVLVGYTMIDLGRFRKSWFFPASKEKINGREILIDYALPYFITLIVGLVFSNFQIILLASLQSQYVTGTYSMSFLVASLITIIPGVLTQALFPIISLLSVGRKRQQQTYLLQIVLRYALFLMLPAAIFLVSFSKPILLLLRHEYLGATNLLSTLVVACMVFGLANLFLFSLYAAGKTKLSRNIWIVSAIFFLFIAPLLIKTYSSQGLALAYLISSFFIFCLSYHFIKKELSLELQWENLLKLVCSSVIFLLFLLFSDILEASLLIKILVALSGAIAYLVLLLPLRFYTQQDIRLLEFIATKVPILKKQILSLAKFISKWLEPNQT